MKDLRCNMTGCDRAVLTYRPKDFGLALVFCVEHAISFIKSGGLSQMPKGFSGELEVTASREDG